MKKTILAVALVVFFVMALAVPAFAQSMTHTKTAEIDGTIDWELQAGHLCNTGAEFKSTIQGSGQLSKAMTTAQVRGKLTVSDVNDFVAGATNLSIISSIELCAPPKQLMTTTDWVYCDTLGWVAHGATESVLTPLQYYEDLVEETMLVPGTAAWWAHVALGEIDVPAEGDKTTTVTIADVSKQIWAAHVNADPGFSGNLHQDFEAAYGPYGGTVASADDVPATGAGARAFYLQGNTPRIGSTYVGNYFNIEQHARTSMGAVQRFIDISSPWSHAYVMEDMTVVGKSEINEAFSMVNLGPGADVPGDWWDLF